MVINNRGKVGLCKKFAVPVKQKVGSGTAAIKASKDFRFGHRGHQHPYGLCICCDELRVIFVHIPKNGSSSLRSLFSGKQYHGREVNYFDLPEDVRRTYYTFCVLRDVRSRFHSAINTILSRDQTDISGLSADNLCQMVDDMVDAHLVRQIDFVDGLRIDYYLPFSKLGDIPIHKNSYKPEVKETKLIRNIPDKVIDTVYARDSKLVRKHLNNSSGHARFMRRLRLK